MTAVVFSLFSSLPAELRNQIWIDALPDKVGQALYFYKKGCWWPRYRKEAEPNYDFGNYENNLIFEFRHDLLDHVQFELPLFFVNREARGITLAWIQNQGIKIRFQEDRQSPTFVRLFDPIHDTLYVPHDQWDDCLREPYDRLFEPDLVERNVDCPGPAFTRIAVPEVLLRKEVDPLVDFFDWYYSLKEVFIVVDTPPDLQPEHNDIAGQQRWELESMQGATFSWTIDRGGFEWQDREYISDKALCKWIEQACIGLSEKLIDNNKRSFEIRPVFALRK